MKIQHIAECGAGMINAVGLQNPGIDAVIREELPRLKTFFRKPVIANISGFSVEEYAYCCERIDKQEQVGIIEVNVSCPNVRHGGMSFGTCPDAAAEVIEASRYVSEFRGGEGAVRDIVEQVLRARGDWAKNSEGVTPSSLAASR